MKKPVKRLLTMLIAAAAGAMLLPGCATICANRMQTVHLFDEPSDLKITVDGQEVLDSKPADKHSDQPYFSMDHFANTANYATGTQTIFYVKSLRVRGFKTHKIVFHSDALGKTDTLTVIPKFNFRWVWGNLFSFGVPGMIVDGVTGKWKNIRPNFVDVPAVLNHTPMRSKGKLKRAAKRQIRRGH